jgi:transposase-like protein
MKHYGAEERALYLAKYSRYGGTIKSFCESEGIKAGTFQYWLKSSRKQKELPSFIEVVSSQAPSRQSRYIEITTSTGTTIKVPV